MARLVINIHKPILRQLLYQNANSLRFVQIKSFSSKFMTSLQQSSVNDQQQSAKLKLIYEGKLTKRILHLKGFSILSSLTFSSFYGFALSKKGFSAVIAITGLAFTPLLLSPFFIAWLFKRYIIQLYYDSSTKTFTAYHYGLLWNRKSCTFKKEDVVRSDLTSLLSNFKVGGKSFFLHDEDLIDIESVKLYKEMIGLDRELVDKNK